MTIRISFAIAMISLGAIAARGAEEVTFNKDIRPILSNNCFMCHGPDGRQRKAKLRLDLAEDAVAEHKSGKPFVAGDVAKSQAIARVTATDGEKLMPPGDSGKKLSGRQIELLKAWVAQGAKYEKHWAFVPPRRPELPSVKEARWNGNPIDRFVAAKLESEGLRPMPEADKVTLCRRVFLDLLGLPPMPKEVDEFLADASPDAYEKLVDRLMANPHHGERLALDWLDAARYADTHGYHIDSGRDQTRWREWVIDAFNSNKPFDEFTIEQLAGDLIPNATPRQIMATGFVRNNMINFEGGAIPEEYLNAYLVDRVNTTSMVWLGVTLNCCQCHDHKYDPFKQKDFYSLYAFFNAVPESGLDGRKGNAAPVLKSPSSEQTHTLEELAANIAKQKATLAGPMPELDAEQAEWEATALERHPEWTTLKANKVTSKYGEKMTIGKDAAVAVSGILPDNDTFNFYAKAEGKRITAIRLEALPGTGPKGKIGRSSNGNAILTDFAVTCDSNKLKIRAASADFSQEGYEVSKAIDDDIKSGWAIFPEVNKPHRAVFELAEPLTVEPGTELTITLKFNAPTTEHIFGRFRLSATDSSTPHGGEVLPGTVRAALKLAAETRSAKQKSDIQQFFRTIVCTKTRAMVDQIAKWQAEQKEVEGKIPTTMVMADMATPRQTFVLMRGQYDKKGDEVTANVPEELAPLPKGAPHNRLGLAQWLVSKEQPLVARVIVNRYWQSIFGVGLVKTVEDFGSQGEEPVNQSLLDWLAVQFRDGDEHVKPWDVRALLKLIVMSKTYRQASATTPELLARDPENRLLAHGARIRLPAELIRDQALAVSGLLNDQIGGKSVSPYQPAGLWEELMSRADGANWTAQTYTQDHGKDLYRRTMYTFWKRTSPPPTLATFDAPDRETCTVRRSRTNTPLQALVLMNDPTYVEASRKLAERLMREAGPSDEAKIDYAFRLTIARRPTSAEVAVVQRIHDRELAKYRENTELAKKLLTVGEAPYDDKLNPAELAAWSTVASVVLNLDETITKG